MPDNDTLFVCWLVATCVAIGGWFGCFAGRRYERTKAVAHRVRKRRPYAITIDYDFAVAALKEAGYKVEPAQERLH